MKTFLTFGKQKEAKLLVLTLIFFDFFFFSYYHLYMLIFAYYDNLGAKNISAESPKYFQNGPFLT